ncbi:hypothetical protein [Kribbella sp. NPDC004536]|uniref:hypothetical protein n=1 Tax=Kribbella sp. NPDC004536 TaxID=3364106 RepID=UPI00369603B3
MSGGLSGEQYAEVGRALRTGCYRIDGPDEAAALLAAWLLERGRDVAALEVRPSMPTLTAFPPGVVVRRHTVDEVRTQLRQATVRPRVAAMRETLEVWNPLYDQLVALWCDTVDGELPQLTASGVVGGWPCRVWPDDWAERRRRWLDDHKTAAELHNARRPKSNFARLQAALEQCPDDSSALDGRDVGWIRRALANTISAHGAPSSERRTALRTTQREVVAHPPYATLAHVLSARLDAFPRAGGLPSLEAIADPVDCTEAPAAAGATMPEHLLAKASRALEAPIGELVSRGVIPSGEVLADVLPQVRDQLLAANIADASLALLYAKTTAAGRRDLLPWFTPYRGHRADPVQAASQTLRETTIAALAAFPEAILPPKLVRELGTLAGQAGLDLPLVDEHTCASARRAAAVVASRVLAGTLYARYYDLPVWPERRSRLRRRRPADDFTQTCTRRAANGSTVLEQSQILTTHNLAVLVDALDLTSWLQELAPRLAAKAFTSAIHRPTTTAWRQAIFYLSYCDPTDPLAELDAPHLQPAITGLLDVAAGHRFDYAGRTPNGGRRFTAAPAAASLW